MFAQRYNKLELELSLFPLGPLLIKEGRHHEQGDRRRRSFLQRPDVERNPPRPQAREGRGYGDYDSDEACFDMAMVWSKTASGSRFYLPGSSLKGVLRRTAERIIGRWQPGWVRASDPFDNHAAAWVERMRADERHPDGAAIYREAGPIERCFGHTALRGRWSIADAWMVDERAAGLVVRDGVGISRSSGAAENAIKFMFEAVTGGQFTTTITLVNYELWQLGLLAHGLAALDGGQVRLGYGTHRGLGRVGVQVRALHWQWYNRHTPGATLSVPALAALSGAAGEAYGLRDDEAGPLLLDEIAEQREGLGSAALWRITPDTREGRTDWDASLWERMAAPLPIALRSWEAPPALRAGRSIP
jgi:CRISPR/Cas system CSM-associated protein Csm3 (group 7 of RAMP superfamily)